MEINPGVNQEKQMLKIGDPVIYVDEVGKELPALVTANWGEQDPFPCINVVFVHKDEDRTDTYGRQIDRESSVTHDDAVKAHGRFWKYGDDRDNAK